MRSRTSQQMSLGWTFKSRQYGNSKRRIGLRGPYRASMRQVSQTYSLSQPPSSPPSPQELLPTSAPRPATDAPGSTTRPPRVTENGPQTPGGGRSSHAGRLLLVSLVTWLLAMISDVLASVTCTVTLNDLDALQHGQAVTLTCRTTPPGLGPILNGDYGG